ncbi:MAG: hypothetical protein JO021_10250 [Alphaproteobacteria bacterium]|nr:hypothetical protein [Alphaproteobacteria bacterium]
MYPWLIAALGICGALAFLPFLAELPPHLEAMRTLAAGDAVADRFYPVGYPAMLAPGYALRGLDGVIACQALTYAASVLLFWHLLRRAGADRTVVSLATAALALHPYLLLNIQRINDNALNVPLVLALLGLMVDPALWRGRATPAWLGAGMGLLAAIRPNALLLALLPLALMAGEPRARLRIGVYLGAMLGLFVSVSGLATGDPLFFPRNGPYNLFAGNNPLTAAALRTGYNGEASVVPALAAGGIATDAPTELAPRIYVALAMDFIAGHPVHALGLAALKIANLLRPDWQFADDAWEAAAQTVVALPLVLWLIAWAADARYRASRRCRIVLAIALLFVIPFALTNSDPRFRLPLDVVFLLESATVFGLSAWPRRLRARRRDAPA